MCQFFNQQFFENQLHVYSILKIIQLVVKLWKICWNSIFTHHVFPATATLLHAATSDAVKYKMYDSWDEEQEKLFNAFLISTWRFYIKHSTKQKTVYNTRSVFVLALPRARMNEHEHENWTFCEMNIKNFAIFSAPGNSTFLMINSWTEVDQGKLGCGEKEFSTCHKLSEITRCPVPFVRSPKGWRAGLGTCRISHQIIFHWKMSIIKFFH